MTVPTIRLTRRKTAAAACAVVAVVALLASGVAPAFGGSTRAKAPQQSVAHKSVAAVAKDRTVKAGSRYLALGDAIAFGYREPGSIRYPNFAKAKNFVGFPEDVAANLGLKLTNASCPGETTASFMNVKAQSNGCENSFASGGPPTLVGYRLSHPLHTTYKNKSQSQLAFAKQFLKAHPSTRLVTLMIGRDDGSVCQQRYSDDCASEAAAVTKRMTTHIRTIFRALRESAHYQGQIVLVSYYTPIYGDGIDNDMAVALNRGLVKAAKGFHVQIADGYGQFRRASVQGDGNACAAQLLTQLKPRSQGCGSHPSFAGQALLAQAVERAIKK
jgi:lysophospholipase L1-like esterase